MDSENKAKEYRSVKIPDRQQLQRGLDDQAPPQGNLPSVKNSATTPLGDGLFYEIEYDLGPIKGVGKFVLKSQKIEEQPKDEVRELFYRMRDLARQDSSSFTSHSRFFDRRVQQDIANIFYKQAVFMKDFEDDYPKEVSFSSYFPYYQMLSYEQLRAYFTWRTQVRKGIISDISLSYVFLYLYELLNNIGVKNPQDGLETLLSFWTIFQTMDASIDKYIIRWLKDYHIYYGLSQSFWDFAEEHGLTEKYPAMSNPKDSFDLFCAISKYDIRKSAFFTEQTSALITDCFYFVIDKIKEKLESVGIHFEEALFRPTKKVAIWRPFKDALFHQRRKQPDRQIIISEKEIYRCSKNQWTFSTMITTEQGKQFIGYVMKQMESVLRKITKHVYNITAKTDMMNSKTLGKLEKAGLDLEKIVSAAVIEYDRELNKTVVSVDYDALARIRREAKDTLEALIVEQPVELLVAQQDRNQAPDQFMTKPATLSLGWASLKEMLSEREIKALGILLHGESDLKQFADDNGVMLEVLADGINEKAVDSIGDNLLDDNLELYEDYEEQVKGMVESS